MIQEKKATIDALSFYYKLVGDPQNPSLVFLHGHPMPDLPAERFDYSNVLLELAKYFYVIAPEHIGTMRSDPPQKPISKEERAEVIHKLLESLKIRTPIMMGQSFGGGVALVYAHLYPQKVKTLILVDAVTDYRKRTYFILGAIRYWLYKSLFALPLSLDFKRNLVYWSSKRAKLPESDLRKYLNQLHPINYVINVDYLRLKTPTILVWGKNDWFITPVSDAYRLKRKIKGSRLVLVDGGHTILYQDPEYVVGEIVKSLNLL